jgi:predicted Zn-dependent protease
MRRGVNLMECHVRQFDMIEKKDFMKMIFRVIRITVFALFLQVALSSGVHAQLSTHSIQTIERAITDELARSKSELKLKGLVDPCFISYTVSDNVELSVQASFGALLKSEETHSREENARLLLNNYQLDDENYNDNSNIFSQRSTPDNTLPLDDDYAGIRRALWLSTDDLFKDANETFTKKKAALANKQLSDDVKNLPDFTPAPIVNVEVEPVALNIDRAKVESLAKAISGIFSEYPGILNCSALITISNAYQFIRNTEGSNVRMPATLCEIRVVASAQADEDGEPLALMYLITEPTPEALPITEALLKRTRDLAASLEALRHAPRFSEKSYTGPVLFEGRAATDYFVSNVLARLSAKREDVLGGPDMMSMIGGGSPGSLKDKLNTRILPESVMLIDDPTLAEYKAKPLFGNYQVDEECVVPTKALHLVENGILRTLYMTRTPTKEVREPNGHARPMATSAPGTSGDAAGPGVVIFKDTKAFTDKALRKELFKRAKDDGYDYALVVRGIRSMNELAFDGNAGMSEFLAMGKTIQPSLIYKVYPDGREELLRGAEIALPTTRDLREIETSSTITATNLLAPTSTSAFGFAQTVATSLIGPSAILCPELEVQRQNQKATPSKPVVERPAN